MLLGKEPHYNWLAYSNVLVDAMTRLGIVRLVTVGGVQDTISHSSPPAVSVVASSLLVLEETAQLEPSVRPAEYSGPISIHSSLLAASAEAGIPAVSLWAHVPAYLQKNPRMVATLMKILNKNAGTDCPVDGLMKESIEMDRKIDEAMARDPNLKQFVEAIEGRRDSQEDSSREDNIIRLNDFLRRDPNRDPEPS
jgi:predicted ATP-grasp superfamily ATP-dependent carboligase